MSNIYIQYASLKASMNLSRFRFDITTYFNDNNKEEMVMSRNKGSSPKARSEMIKSVLIKHKVR